jgi:hypothetical protein
MELRRHSPPLLRPLLHQHHLTALHPLTRLHRWERGQRRGSRGSRSRGRGGRNRGVHPTTTPHATHRSGGGSWGSCACSSPCTGATGCRLPPQGSSVPSEGVALGQGAHVHRVPHGTPGECAASHARGLGCGQGGGGDGVHRQPGAVLLKLPLATGDDSWDDSGSDSCCLHTYNYARGCSRGRGSRSRSCSRSLHCSRSRSHSLRCSRSRSFPG